MYILLLLTGCICELLVADDGLLLVMIYMYINMYNTIIITYISIVDMDLYIEYYYIILALYSILINTTYF